MLLSRTTNLIKVRKSKNLYKEIHIKSLNVVKNFSNFVGDKAREPCRFIFDE